MCYVVNVNAENDIHAMHVCLTGNYRTTSVVSDGHKAYDTLVRRQ